MVDQSVFSFFIVCKCDISGVFHLMMILLRILCRLRVKTTLVNFDLSAVLLPVPGQSLTPSLMQPHTHTHSLLNAEAHRFFS